MVEVLAETDPDIFPVGSDPISSGSSTAHSATIAHESTFNSLPISRQHEHFRDVAQRALPLWGYPQTATLTLLNITENASFRVDSPGMPTIVMRVHRLDYAELESIETEMSWIAHLSGEPRLHLVTPIRSAAGRLVETIETPWLSERRHVACFEFIEGAAPHDSQDDVAAIGRLINTLSPVPDAITTRLFRGAAVGFETVARLEDRLGRRRELPAPDARLYQRLGEIAALIHTRTQSWTPPAGYHRIEWGWEATFGTGWNNYYGKHYWECDLLSASDIHDIDACQTLIGRRLAAFGTGPKRYGMIHSDLRPANIIAHHDVLTVLDFDDCGRGWYLTDIAGIVGLDEHRADLAQVLEAVVTGYRRYRELDEDDVREIATFVMIRRIGLLEALQYHLDNVVPGEGESFELCPEIAAFYAKGTAVLARRYLKQYAHAPLARPESGEPTEQDAA